MYMMALGDYRFQIATAAYQTLQRTTTWRWPTQERMGLHPAPQHVGKGDDTITLAGVILPHFRGGLGQLDAMRAQANPGVPLLLVDGQGYVHGYWVIESVAESQSQHLDNGAPLKIEFTVQLRYYGVNPTTGMI